MKTAALLSTLLGLLAASVSVSAHPGEDHAHEAAERAAALATIGARSLSHCADQLAARGVHARNNLRRRSLLHQEQEQLRRKRDLAAVVGTSHKSNLTGITNATSAATVFGGTNECILAPDVTQGPYYVTGEYVRADVTETQAGVPLLIDIQVIDTNTCQPLPGAAIDFWHCNATGVYSGVVASGNGDSSDASNINATFLRGIQETDADGVVQFRSIVPGHYSGRTTHVHMMAHANGTWSKLDNGTITGGTSAAHVGQLFFDQDLLTQVAAVAPYSTNTQSTTANADDNIMSQAAASVDPVVEYVLLGDSVADGVFAWIAIGINASASESVQPATVYGADGGVANANSMGGGPGGGGAGGPGGPGGNGTAPGGMGMGTGNGTAGPGGMMGNGTGPDGNGTTALGTSGSGVAAADAAATSSGTSAAARASPTPLIVLAALLALPLALLSLIRG